MTATYGKSVGASLSLSNAARSGPNTVRSCKRGARDLTVKLGQGFGVDYLKLVAPSTESFRPVKFPRRCRGNGIIDRNVSLTAWIESFRDEKLFSKKKLIDVILTI
jgi:hypothetical protein